jgi:serine phosphatase RsbU (regulator of sigma subunit)/CHASE2 domain-containing sensor protein
LKQPLRRWEGLPRQLLPLVYLIPLAYLFWPVLWAPLDGRFFSFFHSRRQVAPWTEVAVVGIDRATREQTFGRPVFPLSRHASEHAEITRKLTAAGARDIVFDLALGADTYATPPVELADAFRASDRVYLVLSLAESRLPGGALVLQPLLQPDPILEGASKGAFIVDMDADEDGIIRRFESDPRLERLGLETLPERVAGVRHEGPMPIEFPSVERPIPTLSYAAVLSGEDSAAGVAGRIAFVGLIEDPTTDFVSVPRRQILEEGIESFGLPGVMVLAATTETLLRGAPIRDAGWLSTLLWNIFWSVVCVAAIPRKRPELAAFVVLGVIGVALLAAGLLHVQADLIFPAGLLLGCLFIIGAHAIIASYVHTAKELHAEEVENERVQKEMETARTTQVGFLPKDIPAFPGLDIWGTNISSLAVSGDYYDVIDLGEGSPIVFTIADVSGKGLPASLLMSNVQAGLHCHAYQEHLFDLERAADHLNRLVYENTEPGKFVTMFLAEIDKKTHHVRYVRAGHDAPIVVSADGAVSTLEEGTCVLGFIGESMCEVADLDLNPGDVLCLYTDGITEAWSPGGEEFEIERIMEVLVANREKTSKEIGKALIDAVWAWTKIEHQADDVTMIILKAG